MTIKPIHRSLLFGVLSGLVWSLVPGTLLEEWQSTGQTLSILAAGLVAGVVVSLILYRPLQKKDWWRVLALGVASLPLGAFVYGFTISILHLAIWRFLGVSYRYILYGFEPFETAFSYAGGSFILTPPLVLVFAPLAIATTCLLRYVVTTRRLEWHWRF